MFGKKLKQDLRIVQLKLAQTESEVTKLQNALSSAERELSIARAGMLQAQSDCEISKLIYRNMQTFGESFTAMQQSQVAAALSLKEEKVHAIEAATVSAGNGEAVEKIAHSLEGLSSDTLRSSGNVENLAQRAAQIGSIVQLIKDDRRSN